MIGGKATGDGGEEKNAGVLRLRALRSAQDDRLCCGLWVHLVE